MPFVRRFGHLELQKVNSTYPAPAHSWTLVTESILKIGLRDRKSARHCMTSYLTSAKTAPTCYAPRKYLSAYLSGSGANGIVGALSYLALRQAGLSLTVTLLLMLIIPASQMLR